MKYKTALISLLILLLLSAFAQNPKPAGSSLLRPLLALPLPEGRTLDEGHDSGFIDWSGSVGYINLNHKDGICPTGCVEQVTRISNGGTVSGAFAPVDVAYFEVMAAFTHNSGAGTAVLNACGSSAAWYLYVGPGSGLPGFVSMSVPVPSGCASWSLSASGGYVDFRSVDANYVSPPPPVATSTFTPIPTATFTSSPTATGTPVPTETFTPSPTETGTPVPTTTFTPTLTATDTLTPTVTETLAPGVTPSDTPSPTLTSAPSATLPPGVTPSDTPVPTNTPIPPAPTNTPVQPPPSNGGQGGNGGFILPTATFVQTVFSLPTSTPTVGSISGFVSATPNLVETARVMIFGTSTPTPTPKPIGRAGKAGSSFPWWLLAAGGAAIYAVGKRKQIARGISNYQLKIRERKRKALEAASKRNPPSGTMQVRAAALSVASSLSRRLSKRGNKAVDAKLARMEAEEERRAAQRPTVQPKPAVPTSATHSFPRKPVPSAKPAGLSLSKPSLWSRFTSGIKTLTAPLVNTISKPAAPSAKPSLWSRFTSAVKGTVKKIAPVVNTVKTVARNMASAVAEMLSTQKTSKQTAPEKVGPPWLDYLKAKWKNLKQWGSDNLVQPSRTFYSKTVNRAKSLFSALQNKAGTLIREAAIYFIPRAAEFVYRNVYLPTVSFANKHPYLTDKTTQAINFMLDGVIRPTLNRAVDTNPKTMGWIDLGMTWLFELGNKHELVFGPDAKLTQDIMKHNVIQDVRSAAIEKIAEGRIEDVLPDCTSPDAPVPPGQYPVCKPSQFGVTKYFQSLGEAIRGDLSQEYLGSYTVTIYVEPRGNGWYVFRYVVKNPSTWESATRFRVDSPNDNDTVNEGIIPDTSGRGIGITLGGRLDQTFEWSEEIYIPEGEGK